MTEEIQSGELPRPAKSFRRNRKSRLRGAKEETQRRPATGRSDLRWWGAIVIFALVVGFGWLIYDRPVELPFGKALLGL